MTHKEILKAVLEVIGISEHRAKSRSTYDDILTAKELYCYYAYNLTSETLQEIGGLINLSRMSVAQYVSSIIESSNSRACRIYAKEINKILGIDSDTLPIHNPRTIKTEA